MLSEVFGFHTSRSKTVSSATTSPRCTPTGTTSSSCSTSLERGQEATSTTSSWTSSSARTTWSPCTDRSTLGCRRRWPCARPRPCCNESGRGGSARLVVRAVLRHRLRSPGTRRASSRPCPRRVALEQQTTAGTSAIPSEFLEELFAPATGCLRCAPWQPRAQRSTDGWHPGPFCTPRRGRWWRHRRPVRAGSRRGRRSEGSSCRASSSSTEPGRDQDGHRGRAAGPDRRPSPCPILHGAVVGYGMNLIVNDRTDFPHLVVVLAVMATISAMLLRWAKRQGWW